ncbi:replication initiation protein RepC [Sedimentitalea todarodis]|uniref:Replication initiation protein RepC n=1 Tax=Sedimentitalea todarodis TaxID=1631240 RepID=A0ABU3VJ88_9RHOB|nr:replication initiation protein RepC [Sedimentitalea todarodis]MDU9006244.1 replication initiation protein RepC [Sedimentitalea todarodis]
MNVIQTHLTLPEGWTKGAVMALISEVAPHIGLRPARLAVLNYIIGRTRASDWTSPHREPVFFGAQDLAAVELGKTSRQLRTDEAALAKLGLIVKRVAANGARYGRAGLGLILTPLIARLEEFIALRDRLRAERRHLRALKDLRSLRLRHMKRCIAALPSSAIKDPEIVKILASFDKWPRSDALSRLGLERLNAHLKASSDLCSSLDDWLEKRGLSSDQPAENFRPFTQNTREETQTVKTPPAVDNSERHAEIAQSESPSSIPCPAPPALTPENLYRIAGDGLRMMLDASRDQNRPLKERDIIEAAWALLPMLDIHTSVWHEGQSTLGDHGLAFCLLLVDAQRDHPSYPVRNPGGLMRELIRRAKAGRLDFDASVAALQKRRNGVR